MRYRALSGFVEKRKSPRTEVRWPVTMITEKGSFDGEARNITVGGVFIVLKTPIEDLALSETCFLLIFPAGKPIEVMAEPIWFNPSIPPRVGLCFVEAGKGERELLREAIQKYAIN
jgi:hypothetical protein